MTEVKEELKDDLQAPEGDEELKTKEDGQPAPDDQDNDYKEELERIKTERDNYKEGLLNTKDKLKKEKAKNTDTSELNVDEIKESIRQDAVEDTIADILDDISTNDDEKELIKHNYNRLEKSGYSKSNIIKDLEDAKLLANSKKIYRENKELQHSLLSKQSISNSGGGSSMKRSYEPEAKLKPKEQVLMDRTNARRALRGQDLLTAKEFLGN